MKKLFVFLLAFLGLFLLSAAPVNAINTDLSGQTNQYYSVVFDKEGEAAVLTKLSYVNRGKDEIKTIPLEIPGKNVRIISLVQQSYAPTKYCVTYDYNTAVPAYGQRPCLKWGEELNGQMTFSLLSRDTSKDVAGAESLKIELPLTKTIASGETGNFILYYKAEGFSTAIWEGSKFAFETIRSPYDIDNVRVAVNVVSELFIKETATGEINYESGLKALPALSTETFSVSSEVENAISEIPKAPGLVKETTSLDPNENFKVEGEYYNSKWRADIWTYAAIALTFLLIIGVLIYIIRSEKK